MADRPYRVYRGGGRVRQREGDPELGLDPGTDAPPAPSAGERRGAVVLPPPGAPRAPTPVPGPAPRRRRRRGRIVSLVVGLAVLLLAAWLAVGYLAFSRSIAAANRRLDPAARAALAQQHGLLLSQPTNVLILGADRTKHSDSLQILHLDPGRHLAATLAIPRDLRAVIPGHGADRINAAYAIGGPALAIRAVADFTGLPVNHVIVVSFDGFRQLIDSVGGVDLVSPEPLKSTFDGYTYRFGKGPLHLDGKHALAYARIRKNAYNAADSDVSRGGRQQQVMKALKAKLSSPWRILDLRSVGSELGRPLATDLTANQILSLGWVDFRAQRHLQCHLGGHPQDAAGSSVLLSDGDGNRRVLEELSGTVAVQRVRSSDPFVPGCRTA